jgi:hypothetical protein
VRDAIDLHEGLLALGVASRRGSDLQWRSVSRKRLTTWVLVLAVGMTARITVAAPRAAMAELRAISCCIAHCPTSKPRPAKMPHQCCAIDAAATDPAGTTTAPSLERPALAPLALVAAMPVIRRPAATIVRLAGPALRAGRPGTSTPSSFRC